MNGNAAAEASRTRPFGVVPHLICNRQALMDHMSAVPICLPACVPPLRAKGDAAGREGWVVVVVVVVRVVGGSGGQGGAASLFLPPPIGPPGCQLITFWQTGGFSAL